MFWPENFNKRSQDCEKAFHDAGMFYWFKRSFFEKKLTNIFDNSGYVVYKENEVQDIDNLTDWKIAELKYKALNF
jgi:N-acylneuraminate cytidylyltransferase